MDTRAAAIVATALLQRSNLKLVSLEELQSLWAGYGSIYAVEATSSDAAGAIQKRSIRLIMKVIAPPHAVKETEGHLRKMLSYHVEQYFYERISGLLKDDVAIAECWHSSLDDEFINSQEHPNMMAFILTDLREEFPVAGEKRSVLEQNQVLAAIEWLSKFHKASKQLVKIPHFDLILPPLQEAEQQQHTTRRHQSLWLNGGYTYLATRRSEYKKLSEDLNSEWSATFCESGSRQDATLAEQVATFLTPNGMRPFETCIHGDVKSENMFANASGDRVAFFDFQYAGMGLGVCDLAKLFTCSVPQHMLTTQEPGTNTRLTMDAGEKHLLQIYWETYRDHRKSSDDIKYDWQVFCRHWETALVDWCRFQASWGFWGNTDWLCARVRSIVQDSDWRSWLDSELSK